METTENDEHGSGPRRTAVREFANHWFQQIGNDTSHSQGHQHRL